MAEGVKEGVKETMEALDCITALSVALILAAKDGLQVKDAMTLATNPDIIAKCVAAAEGASKIKDELGDLDSIEIQQLVAVLTASIGKQLAAVGVTPDNRLNKILPLMPDAAALAQKFHDALTK